MTFTYEESLRGRVHELEGQLTAAQLRLEELEREVATAKGFLSHAQADNAALTADNQRLRALLRECLPIVRHSVDERFNVELPTYQNRLQLRDRIKAAIGDK